MKLFLIVAKGKRQGLPIPIKIDLFLIGSAPLCQLRSQRPGVGAQHCMLITRERKVFVRDMNSGEATVVNGNVVPHGEEWPLHAGDRLEVGPLEFLVQFREKALSGRDLEEWAVKCLDENDKGLTEDPEDDPLYARRLDVVNASQAAASILETLSARRGVLRGRLRVGLESGVTLVRFSDTHLVEEAEIGMIRKELREELTRPNLRVLLDFKNVRRLSSSAADMILDTYHWVRARGSTLALCRVRPDLQPILATLHITQTIPLFPDKKAAIAARW